MTADVGPRIIRFGFTEQANEFKEFDSEVGETGGNEWRSYGGHRLWHAPEAIPRTYSPDNSPVEVRSSASGLHAIQSVEALTGIQKEIEITLDEQGAHARLVHRLRNLGLWTVELAAWCLTVMETGGTAIIPLPPRGPHPENLLPTGSIALWAYTDLSDARLTWGREMILMKQDPHSSLPQKIGASVPDGWVAYARSNHLFVKTFKYLPDAVYPDLGCCVEVFTDDEFLEIETLGAVRRLEPGGETEYIEDWYLFDEIPVPASASDVRSNLLPAIRRLL
ncbi:MAG: hypothetical protein ACWGO1_02755 [Anaerolineales bacterium]